MLDIIQILTSLGFPTVIGNIIFGYDPYPFNYAIISFDGSYTGYKDIGVSKKFTAAVRIIVYRILTIMEGSIFSRSIQSIDVYGKVILIGDMTRMFEDAEFFDCDVSKWDMTLVTRTTCMFRGAKSFKGVGTLKWKTYNITDTYGMFQDATSFNGNVSKWNVSRVMDMRYMFYRAASFIGIGLANWEVSRDTEIAAMFMDTRALLELPIWFTTMR